MSHLLNKQTINKETTEGFGPKTDDQGRQYVDIGFANANLITDVQVPTGSSAVLQIFLNSVEMKKVFIEKDNDLLTKEEIRKLLEDVITAVYDELKTWISHDCFRRHPRRNAINILDVRLVLK